MGTKNTEFTTCSECKAWCCCGGDYGECRRKAPEAMTGTGRAVFPETDKDMWCMDALPFNGKPKTFTMLIHEGEING